MDNIDVDIDSYSIEDILSILNLTDPSEYQVKDAANAIIAKMRSEGKQDLAGFFEKAKQKVLDEFQEEEDPPNAQNNENTQLGNWWQNQYPAQANQQQMDKVTQRKQKVQTFDENEHYQMNREQLGVAQTYNLPVQQGTMNPNLKNVTTRIVSIDSQFRQNILNPLGGPPGPGDPAFNTDYTLDLSEPLTNVISMKLYSIQLPTTWYSFSKDIGNTCFTHKTPATDPSCVCIPDGNYNNVFDLSSAIQAAASSAFTISADKSTGILNFASASDVSFVTYAGPGGGYDICSKTCKSNSYINQNIGWDLGFRRQPDACGNIIIDIPASGPVKADVSPDIYGPKYFVLSIDDFNQNHLNKGLVNMTDRPTKLSLPKYYSPADIDPSSCINSSESLVKAPQMTKSNPRKLTQAQLYSVNEILANRQKERVRAPGPTTTDALAIIPLGPIWQNRTALVPYIEFSSSLQNNVRTYFGPVNVERLRVRLTDDKGNLVNLHDHNWSFSLIVEQLYQY